MFLGRLGQQDNYLNRTWRDIRRNFRDQPMVFVYHALEFYGVHSTPLSCFEGLITAASTRPASSQLVTVLAAENIGNCQG